MSDNGTVPDVLTGIDPKIAIILAVVAVMTTLMVWLLKAARDSWDDAQSAGNIHRVNLAYLYAGAVVLGLGSHFTTAFILLARRDFSSSELAYPVAGLMIVQVLLLMIAPIAVMVTPKTTAVTTEKFMKTYGPHYARHVCAILLFVIAVIELSLQFGPDPWARLKWGNIVIAAVVGLLALGGEFWLMWTMAGEQGRQETRGGPTMTSDKNEIWHKQSILVQRALILLGVDSILLVAYAQLVSGHRVLHYALPFSGLVLSGLAVVHFWYKKDDLNKIDPPGAGEGLRQYAKGRWVLIWLSIIFVLIWIVTTVDAWYG